MALNYIFGSSGTGKTNFIINKIIEIQSKNKNLNVIYLVPEQFTLESEKKILKLISGNSMVSTKVLSFKRLAYHFFSEVGLKKFKILDDIGKIMLLRKIFFDIKNEFVYFKKIKITEGFINKLSGTITEFYNCSLSESDIKDIIDNIHEKNDFILKMQDIYLIYKSYCDYIFKEYISTDQFLDILADEIDKTSYLDNTVIFIDGFNGFTLQEYKVIRKLLLKSVDLSISLTIKSSQIYYEDILITDLFYEIKQIINKLTFIAKEEKIKINDPIYLYEDKRHKDILEFLYLEKKFFSFTNEIYNRENNNIKIYSAENIYDEVCFIAKSIANLIRKEKYRYYDIGIVVSEISLYENIIKSEFYKHKIPIFIDKKEDILSHPLLELIRSALDIIIYDWSYESIFRFLKTGLTYLEDEEIDILENYILEFGIKGYKWKQSEWIYGFNYYDKEEIHRLKEKVLNILYSLSSKIERNRLYKIKDISKFIFDMLFNMNIFDKINDLILESEKLGDNDLLRKHSQIWSKVCYIFEKIVEILGDEEVNIKEFANIIESGFLCEKMAIIPPSQDQVILADSERSRIHDVKVLFILGVNEGLFPKITDDITLFNDEERLMIKNLNLYLGKTNTEILFQDKFIIYNLLLKPEELLIITYSQGTLDGKPLFPSFIINRLRNMFKNIFVSLNDDNIFSYKDFMIEKVIRDLNNYSLTGDISNNTLFLYSIFIQDSVYKDILNNVVEIIFKKNNAKILNKNSINKLYGKEIEMTISKFEKYVECPFSFFIKYNLKAKERIIYKILSSDLGNIFHSLLDKLMISINNKEIDVESLNELKISNYVDNCLDSIISKSKNDIFYTYIRSKYFIDRIKKISKRSIWALIEHIKKGKFLLYDSEIKFGGKSILDGIEVNIDKNYRFIFSGRIDRLDIVDLNNKRYIKVIDYKSGNKKFDISDVYNGMQMQLILYLKNILENGKSYFNMKNDSNFELLPAGVFYFNIDDPIVNLDEMLSKDEIKELVLNSYKMSGIILEDEDVIRCIDENINKNYKNSNIVNICINNDGSYSKKSSIIKEEDFYKLMNYTIDKIKDVGISMVKGNIDPIPYKKLDIDACKYCNYNSICKFDYKNKIFNK